MDNQKKLYDMAIISDNKEQKNTINFNKNNDNSNKIINIAIECIFFMLMMFGIFHINSFTDLTPNLISAEEWSIFTFVVVWIIIFLIRFPVYYLLKLKAYVIFAFVSAGVLIYSTVTNLNFIYEQRLFDSNYIYLVACGMFLVLVVAYIYSEIYFAYYDNGIYKTKYDVFLNPDYKFKIWHRLYNGLYIVMIVWFILSETYMININEYFIAIIFIIINVCISNTFTEKVIVSTGHRGNIMVICMQAVFFIIGVVLIFKYFSSQNTMQLFVGLIYVFSMIETLFLCRYKEVK